MISVSKTTHISSLGHAEMNSRRRLLQKTAFQERPVIFDNDGSTLKTLWSERELTTVLARAAVPDGKGVDHFGSDILGLSCDLITSYLF